MKTKELIIENETFTIHFTTELESSDVIYPDSMISIICYPKANMNSNQVENLILNNSDVIISLLKQITEDYPEVYTKYLVSYNLIPPFITFKGSSEIVGKIDSGLWIREKQLFLDEIKRDVRREAVKLLQPYKERITNHGGNYINVIQNRAALGKEFTDNEMPNIVDFANDILKQNQNTNQDLKEDFQAIVMDIGLECFGEITYS